MLPPKFTQRMSAQLGGEYAAFLRAFDEPAKRGLRVNTGRISAEEFIGLSPWALEPTGILDEGFMPCGDVRFIGAHPYHAAGLFYMQEPSAMSAVAEAKKHLVPGMRILDICAAPGGKSGGIAAHMDGGILIANELVPSRAKTLQFTLERLGVTNAVMVNARPDAIACALPEYFDMVLVDAPCSGEGMFRKDAAAITEWSPEHVSSCAARQREILKSAYDCLAGEGVLVYSTCTFSPEENEDNVEFMLLAHPDMRLLSMGRLYPHTSCGEGHFFAVLKKGAGERKTPGALKLPACREAAFTEFEKSSVSELPAGERVLLPDGRVLILPHELPNTLKGIRMLSAGIYAGDMIKGRFEPAHALAMACGTKLHRCIYLQAEDDRLRRFMAGETLSADIPDGWCAVCVQRWTVGLGKAVKGTVKNHIPKGLRMNVPI